MTVKQAEVRNAKEFLHAAFKDGPRLARDVMHESQIYGVPAWAIAQACKEMGASGWLSQNGLMWGVRKA